MNRTISKILLSAIVSLGLLTVISMNAVAAVDAQGCLQSYYMKSYARALPLCQKAAQAGHGQAQFVLGMMYAEGKGGQKSFEAAARWLGAASQQGHLAARYKLQNLENSLSEEARKKQTLSFWRHHKPMPAEQQIREKTTKIKTDKAPATEESIAKKHPLQIETFTEPMTIPLTKYSAPAYPGNRSSSASTYKQPTGIESPTFEPTDIKIIESKAEPIQPQEKPADVGVKEDFSKSWPQYEGINRSETAEIGETLASDMAEANRETDK